MDEYYEYYEYYDCYEQTGCWFYDEIAGVYVPTEWYWWW